MNWVFTTLSWYGMLLILGLMFVPLAKRLLGHFFIDLGYPFAKTLAILFISYLIFILGILHIVPFDRQNIILIALSGLLLNLLIFLKKPQEKGVSKFRINHSLILIIFEELLFISSLFFWTYVRGQEPSIHNLEKFMDFGFMNSILRTRYFPPLDMWLSANPQAPNGFPINYYYFGHLMGSMLIKLNQVKPAVGYNLILSTIFALSVTEAFSLVANIIYTLFTSLNKKILARTDFIKGIILGILGSFTINLGGNLHTIYAFTKGYPTDNPIPFWKILTGYNPSSYWYPNATRFIPYTIHEFPSYSWVVADLHGHVFDIPFVLLTLSMLFIFFVKYNTLKAKNYLSTNYFLLTTIFLGFLTAVHYMTNAFDGPIYLLLTLIILFITFQFTPKFFISILVLIISFILFTLPFSVHFKPFVSGIGVNCAPDFLVQYGKIGPFLFEKDKCQVSPLWMLFVLWGFFWINFIMFIFISYLKNKTRDKLIIQCNNFIFILFTFSTLLLIIPEFFYIKDIYPMHFRANTMFKLGYQAFIMMGVASTYTFFMMKYIPRAFSILLRLIFIFLFFFVAIYPLFSIPSYYGVLKGPVKLDGSLWLNSVYPEDQAIISYLNSRVSGQPVILEAQGDSYTDYERISAFTGLPTVAGWWVHEWLWRGSPDVVGNRIPDVSLLYESPDLNVTKNLLKKYFVKYVIVSTSERKKYPGLKGDKFMQIGRLVFQSPNGEGAIYQVN